MSAYLVEPQHITEIVKWASNPQQGNLSHVYNQITKREIDCDAESLIEILSLANIESLVDMENKLRLNMRAMKINAKASLNILQMVLLLVCLLV
jgi:uncharacterized membrane protein